MQQGFIKLYRKIMDSPVWSDPYYLKLWMYCLMKATHREREVILGNQVITIQPGQFLTGRISLAEDLNKDMKPKLRLSERTWYRYLENLEKWQMLTIKKTNKYSIVSISKWKEYQETDQQLTIKCPSNDHQMSTNKNVKNVKNNKYTRQYDEDSIYLMLAKFFVEQIRKNNPNFKEPNYQKWANDIRLMMEVDKRTEEQIRFLMKWVQEDDFEMANVLSPSKLRKRFDNLILKVKAQKKKSIKVKQEEERKDIPIRRTIDFSEGEDWI